MDLSTEYVGEVVPDRDDDSRILIVTDATTYYSILRSDVVDAEPASGRTMRLWIRHRADVRRAIRVDDHDVLLDAVDVFEMSHPAPKMRTIAGAPTEWTAAAQAKLKAGTSTEGAAKAYVGQCEGGDKFKNNCAHFLSNALIAAGYDDLRQPDICVHARCFTDARRPIRARDMWCWFKDRATKTGGVVVRNTGLWAVFQLDESQYWGGHVVIVDSDRWIYYGTGWYDDWGQHSYQW